MKCLQCDDEMEEVAYTSINHCGLVCEGCDLRIGPYPTLERAEKAVELLRIAMPVAGSE
jgi:hypothetical protein